jgi:hypothetical protein
MYCSDSAFTIYEFNNPKEVKMSDIGVSRIISIIEKYIWKIEREEDARKNA